MNQQLMDNYIQVRKMKKIMEKRHKRGGLDAISKDIYLDVLKQKKDIEKKFPNIRKEYKIKKEQDKCRRSVSSVEKKYKVQFFS